MSCLAIFLSFLQLYQFDFCCTKRYDTGWFINDEKTLVYTWSKGTVYTHYLTIDDNLLKRTATCTENGRLWYVHDEIVVR